MAFELLDYLNQQMEASDISALANYDRDTKHGVINILNALNLGFLVQLNKTNPEAAYQPIETKDASALSVPLSTQQTFDQLSQFLALDAKVWQKLLANSSKNTVDELHQLDITSALGAQGMQELLSGQIENFAGQAPDWVWQQLNLPELVGLTAEPEQDPEAEIEQNIASIQSALLKAQQQQADDDAIQATDHNQNNNFDPAIAAEVSHWFKWLAPIVALAILAFWTQQLLLVPNL